MSDSIHVEETTPVYATHFLMTWDDFTSLGMTIKGKPVALVE